MTKEQAITRVKHSTLYTHDRETADFIIKALEQQTNDCKIFGTKENCFGGATENECEHCDYKIQKLEQYPSDDCVSRQSMLDAITEIDENINMDIYTNEVREIAKKLPPVTPTQCIAAVRFSKDDLREICNERIEVECTHGTCKDCRHWKDSDGVYRRGISAESKCPINIKEVYEGNFYCKWFEKRGSENG